MSLAAFVSPAVAQDPTELNTITVEASDKSKVTETIDAEQIEAEQPTTLNELFAKSPEVVVSGANRTAAQKVYVRGIEETLLNVSVDGARQGGNMYDHSGNFGIDPDFLKRVEIEAGAGSALRGRALLAAQSATRPRIRKISCSRARRTVQC